MLRGALQVCTYIMSGLWGPLQLSWPLLVTVPDWTVCLVQFWKAVQQVTDMVQSGQQPDRFTYAAILWACHRCGEAALACEIYR